MWLYAAFYGLEYWPFLLGITLVAGISFVDDIHSLPDSLRLVFQFAAMFLMFYGWGILNWESWWIIIIALIVCVGATNIYNFMDGINGINGGYTLAVLLPLAWLNKDLAFVDQSLLLWLCWQTWCSASLTTDPKGIRGTGTFIHSLHTNKHNIFPQESLSKCSLS